MDYPIVGGYCLMFVLKIDGIDVEITGSRFTVFEPKNVLYLQVKITERSRFKEEPH